MANHEGDARRAVHPLTRPVAETGSGSRETKKLPRKTLHERLTGVLKKRLVHLGLATGIGLGGGYVAYQNIPAVHQSVDSLGEEAADRWNSITDTLEGPAIEEKFPIALSKENFTSVSKEEEQELWKNTKTVDLENHTFTIGFPVDQETIDKSPNLRMSEEFNAILPPYIDGEKLKQEGVKNIKNISGLERGTEYIIRYDESEYEASVLTIALAGVVQGEGANSFNPAYTNITVIYRNKTTGKTELQQTIGGLYAELLIPNKPYPDNRGFEYGDGVPIKSGDALLRLTTDLQEWDGRGHVLPTQQGQFVIRSIYQQEDPRAPIPLSTNFLSIPNGDIVIME